MNEKLEYIDFWPPALQCIYNHHHLMTLTPSLFRQACNEFLHKFFNIFCSENVKNDNIYTHLHVFSTVCFQHVEHVSRNIILNFSITKWPGPYKGKSSIELIPPVQIMQINYNVIIIFQYTFMTPSPPIYYNFHLIYLTQDTLPFSCRYVMNIYTNYSTFFQSEDDRK